MVVASIKSDTLVFHVPETALNKIKAMQKKNIVKLITLNVGIESFIRLISGV